MAKTRRARIDADNSHRRVTRPRLPIFVKETQGYPTGYLRASSDTIQHDPESRKVGYGFSIILHGLWYDDQRRMFVLAFANESMNVPLTSHHRLFQDSQDSRGDQEWPARMLRRSPALCCGEHLGVRCVIRMSRLSSPAQ